MENETMRRFVIPMLGGSLLLLAIGLAEVDVSPAYGQSGRWSKWLGPLFQGPHGAHGTSESAAESLVPQPSPSVPVKSVTAIPPSSSRRSNTTTVSERTVRAIARSNKPGTSAVSSDADAPPTPDAVLPEAAEAARSGEQRGTSHEASPKAASSSTVGTHEAGHSRLQDGQRLLEPTHQPAPGVAVVATSAANTSAPQASDAEAASAMSSATVSTRKPSSSKPRTSRRLSRPGAQSAVAHAWSEQSAGDRAVRLASGHTANDQQREQVATANGRTFDLNQRFDELKQQLPDEPLDDSPETVSVSDISHHQGQQSTATRAIDSAAPNPRETGNSPDPNLLDESFDAASPVTSRAVGGRLSSNSVFAPLPVPDRKSIVEAADGHPQGHPQDSYSPFGSEVRERAAANRPTGAFNLSPGSAEPGAFAASASAMRSNRNLPASTDGRVWPTTNRPHDPAVPDAPAGSDSLAIRWKVPKELNRGEKAPFQLIIHNNSEQPAIGVTVHVRLPETAQLVDSRPPATPNGNVLQWEIGRIEPDQQVQIDLHLLAETAGELTPAAAVTTTRLTAARVAVLDPQLIVAIEGPEQVALGQATTCTVRVGNRGNGPARRVVLATWVDESLAGGTPTQREYAVGTLLPGHWRDIRLNLVGKTAGTAAIRAVARGAAEIEAQASRQVRVIKPQLSVAIDGPKLRFVDRPAQYTLSVYNPGPAPAENVQVFDLVPEGFRFVEASPGGSFDEQTREVAWFVGSLEPGHTAEVGVQLIPVTPGEHQVTAAAVAESTSVVRTALITRVEGSANLAIEVIDADDPIEVGAETTYEIRLTNRGSVPANDVQVAALLGDGLRAMEAHGPGDAQLEAGRVLFAPSESLEAGQTMTYRIRVRCLEAGQKRLRAFVRSRELVEPMVEEESTRVYADEFAD